MGLSFTVDLSAPEIDGEDFTLEYTLGEDNEPGAITVDIEGDSPQSEWRYFITNDGNNSPELEDEIEPDENGTVSFSHSNAVCEDNSPVELSFNVYAAKTGTVTADSPTNVAWILSSPEEVPVTFDQELCTSDSGSDEGGNGDGGSGDTGGSGGDQAEDEVDETGNLTPAGLAKVAKKWASAPQGTAQNTAVGFMQRLYLGIFLRQGDQGGLEYWANLRQAGVSEQQIISSFLNSPEGHKALGQFDTQRLLNFLYNNILARTADQTGLSYWTNMLEQRRITTENLIAFFINSAELNHLLNSGR